MAAPIPKPGVLDIQPYDPGPAGAPGAVVELSQNEGALGPSPRAVAAFREAAGSLHRYPETSAAALRHAIGKRFGLDPAGIVCGAASDQLIMLLVQAYAGAGDEVLFPQHSFVLYEMATRSHSATPVTAPLRDLRIDVDALLARAGARTRICIVTNPNNPTGMYLPAGEMRRLREGLPPQVLLLIDAAYSEFVVRDDYTAGADLVEARDDTVMLRTFSKIFGLAGLRLGWAYCPPPVADVLNRVRSTYSISSAAIAAGIAALEDVGSYERSVAHNTRCLARLTAALTDLGLPVAPSVANFVLVEFPHQGPKTAAAAGAFLRARGILVRSFGGSALPHHLRISIGTDGELQALLDALRDFLRSSEGGRP